MSAHKSHLAFGQYFLCQRSKTHFEIKAKGKTKFVSRETFRKENEEKNQNGHYCFTLNNDGIINGIMTVYGIRTKEKKIFLFPAAGKHLKVCFT